MSQVTQKFYVGQRVTWLHEEMRGTVTSLDRYPRSGWVVVEPDKPGGDWLAWGWENKESIRPLNALEKMSEA